ncbi:MAG: TRAP transporter fused permease subunit [Rhodobacteraceae bacterium]|nr:TRAP transporter fused permease subunit [Paracoccaceae bacterium]
MRAERSDSPVTRGMFHVATLLASVATLVAIAFALNVPRRLGLALFTEQYLALILALVLGIIFLSRPLFRGWFVGIDILCAVAGLTMAGYVALYYPVLVNELVYKPLDGVIISVSLALLTLEAVRRATGWGLTIVVALFLVYGVAGHLLPFGMSRQILPDRLFLYVSMDTNGMIGLPLLVACVVVFAFIFMGQVLVASGGSAFFNDLAMSIVGQARGGAAKISVVSSFLFGSISGSAVANVGASGVVTVPLMKRAGYTPRMAASVEALASTGGQLAPPIMGAAAFLMAEFLQIPYSTVILAAIIPTALYYFALFLFIHTHATANRLSLPDDVELPRLRDVLLRGWHLIAPFVVLIGGLFWLNWRPEVAALAGAGTMIALGLVVGYRGTRLGIAGLLSTLPGTGRGMVEIVVIAAAAGLVIGVLNITGLSFSMTLQLVQLAAGNLFILLGVAAVTSIVLGMGMPTVGIYVLLAALIGPAMVQAGVNQIAAHMFLLYFGMLSMITPPVALASFTAASLAGSGPMETGVQAVKMGWVAYLIPFLIVMEPGLVMQADPVTVLWNLGGAIVGVVFATAAIYGFWRRRLRWWERAGLLVLALVALIPMSVETGAGYLPNLMAAGLGGAFLLSLKQDWAGPPRRERAPR